MPAIVRHNVNCGPWSRDDRRPCVISTPGWHVQLASWAVQRNRAHARWRGERMLPFGLREGFAVCGID